MTLQTVKHVNMENENANKIKREHCETLFMLFFLEKLNFIFEKSLLIQ